MILWPGYMVRVRKPDAAVSTTKLRVVTLTIGCRGGMPGPGAGARLRGSLFSVFAPACKSDLSPATGTESCIDQHARTQTLRVESCHIGSDHSAGKGVKVFSGSCMRMAFPLLL